MARFSIVTPSYRQLGWLKRCVRSVADQKGVTVEHIVQDAGTGPELEHWLAGQTSVQLYVEKDSGMYDGINRGLRKATGDIIGYLNCDEQYLPGSLATVAGFFKRHPGCQMVVGNALIVDAAGSLLAFRKVTPLKAVLIMTDHLYALTCGIFFRRSLLEHGLFFDPSYRVAGDADWICRVIAAGMKIGYTSTYLGALTLTGEDLSAPEEASSEMRSLYERAPAWARKGRSVLRLGRHLQKWLTGGYRNGPIRYQIYTDEESESRADLCSQQPSSRHPWA